MQIQPSHLRASHTADMDNFTGPEYSTYTHSRGLTERGSQFMNGLPTVIDFENGVVVGVWFVVGTVEEWAADRYARRHIKE